MRKATYLRMFLQLTLAIASVYSAAAQREEQKIKVPRIVAQQSETVSTATGAMPLTTLINPGKAGLYRISFYWIQTTSPLCGDNCNGQGELNLIFHWTDDAGPQSGNGGGQLGPFFNSFLPLSFGQPVPVVGLFVVRANAGVPLQYEFSAENSVGDEGATYEYFITVEQLQ